MATRLFRRIMTANFKADVAVFRPSTNTWFISKSSGGTDIIGFGAAGDKPVPADYDGDRKADIAIFRPMAQAEMPMVD